ncbi:MAG: hypothetical protein QW580_02155 [Nitrososphaerota archaeon]
MSVSSSESWPIYNSSLKNIIADFQSFCSCVAVSPQQPVIVPATILGSMEVSCVVVVDRDKSPDQPVIEGVIGGREIAHMLVKNTDVWRHFMRVTAREASIPPSLIAEDNTLADLLNQMSNSGYGVAVVGGLRPRVLDLLIVLRYLRIKSPAMAMLTKYRAADFSSRKVLSIGMDFTVRESVHLMLNKGVRRLIVEPSKLILSDRSVIGFCFGSIQGMEMIRDNPDALLDQTIGELGEFLLKPAIIDANDNLATVLNALLASEAKCCLLDGGDGIITPWDLSIRLYQKVSAQARPM